MTEPFVWRYPSTLESVTDGDTALFMCDQGCRSFTKRKVRAEVIDAPEKAEDRAGWDAAKAEALRVLASSTKFLIVSRKLDAWDRILGTIQLLDGPYAGRDFGELMYESGLVAYYEGRTLKHATERWVLAG
jgi:endonuclease YncB( thermonuclease family)